MALKIHPNAINTQANTIIQVIEKPNISTDSPYRGLPRETPIAKKIFVIASIDAKSLFPKSFPANIEGPDKYE